MKKNKKKIVLFAGIIVLFLFIAWQIVMKQMVRRVNNITFNTIDLSTVSDGDYTGEYTISPVYAKVKVSVKDRQLTNIEILRHNNGLGSAAETIVNIVIKSQSLEVDTVSGATISSKCILKAIENAVRKEN